MLERYQYDALIAEYDLIRFRHEQEAEERSKDIYASHPALSKNHDLLRENAMALAKAKITGSSDLPTLQETREALKCERAALLESYGLKEDDFLPAYDCKECKDTGFVGNTRCRCFLRKEARYLYENSRLSNVLKKENFDTLRTDVYSRLPGDDGHSVYDRMMQLISYCRRYVDTFETERRSILFHGNTGVGKTFLTNCIAKELMDRGFSVLYFSSFSLFETLSKIRFSREEDEELPDTSWLYDCDLLIIDDLGTELVNSFVESELFHIISERLRGARSTIISTNLNPASLAERYTERTASRILSEYDTILLTGEDIRNKMKAMANTPK